MCTSLFDKFPDEKFDLAIVDEARDFHKNWFSALNTIIKDDKYFSSTILFKLRLKIA